MVTDDKEITIIDLILFVKKYFLIVLFVPLFISLIAYFGSAFTTKYYSSQITFSHLQHLPVVLVRCHLLLWEE